jgi:hypothetical protein
MWDPNKITPIGKTYAQIDKEQEEYIRRANEELKLASNLSVRWWRYLVSHCTFVLVVGDPLGEQNMVLWLSACRYISGPVSWSNQKLKIEWYNSPTSAKRMWDFTLIDEAVGFKVEAGTFAWERNYNLLEKDI